MEKISISKAAVDDVVAVAAPEAPVVVDTEVVAAPGEVVAEDLVEGNHGEAPVKGNNVAALVEEEVPQPPAVVAQVPQPPFFDFGDVEDEIARVLPRRVLKRKAYSLRRKMQKKSRNRAANRRKKLRKLGWMINEAAPGDDAGGSDEDAGDSDEDSGGSHSDSGGPMTTPVVRQQR